MISNRFEHMPPVDYDDVAPVYDQRYERNRFEGVEESLRRFLSGDAVKAVAEVGCGTGHWLQSIGSVAARCLIAGVDLSAAMLARARAAAPSALLALGEAALLPWAAASFDRVFCINALHHFAHRETFYAECARVLRPGGAFLTIGLDPDPSVDSWWIYDYFPAALAADRARYPRAEAIRSDLSTAGFVNVETSVAQHLPAAVPFEKAEARGFLDRRATSQLMVISDVDWEAGLARLTADRPILRADLRLYATTGSLLY